MRNNIRTFVTVRAVLAVTIFMTVSCIPAVSQSDTASTAQIQLPEGHYVAPFLADTLFPIYTRIGSLSAEQRANLATERIKDLRQDLYFEPDSLTIDSFGRYTHIIYKGVHLISISDEDAHFANTSRDSLAMEYREIIKTSVEKHFSQTDIVVISKKIAWGLVVLIVLIALIKLIGWAFRWTARKIEEQEGKLLKGIKIRSYTLYDAGNEVKVLLLINKIIKWLFILISIYVSLPVLFSIFPWTERLADTLLGFILTPLKKMLIGIWHYLPDLFTILVIIIVFRYILRLIKYLRWEVAFGRLKIPGFYPDWANPTYQIIRILVLAFMIVVIFPYLPGSDSPVFKGVSVFLGFLFTFGSAGSLSNVISGIVLTYMRLYRKGDRVKIGNVTGDVIERSMLVTRIRTIKNEVISIPNSTVMNSHTINYSVDAPEKGLIIHSNVTIGYDVPWKDVHEALLTAAERTELILEEPSPFVLQTSLDDFYVTYQVNGYTKEPNKQAKIYSDLHQHILDCFNEKGIEIMSPHYSAIRDGNKSTVSENHLPEGYTPPPFNIRNIGGKGPSTE
jgi:small-conductance mechanosensitive channel